MTEECVVLSIPSAEFINNLPFDPQLDHKLVYFLLLVAVAQRATKIHFDPNEIARAWITIDGMDYEQIAAFKDDVARMIRLERRTNHSGKEKSKESIPVLLKIASKTVELLVCINSPALDIYITDTKEAFREATEIFDSLPF